MPEETYDLVISDVEIYDGTGNERYPGAVAVKDGTISVKRGREPIPSRRTIEGNGRCLAPGFIDLHAHSALMLLANPQHEPKLLQGVTTELIGVDGNSYAPFREAQHFEDFKLLNAGLDGDPDVEVAYSSVSDYLASYDGRVAVNIAYIVGNSPLRINSVGWGTDEAGPRQRADMRAQLKDALEEGAFGLSTGLDYPPGEFASTDELVALSEVVADVGGIYHTHVRNRLGDRFLDPLREAIEIGRRSGSAVHITHLYRRVWHTRPAAALLELLEEAKAEGIDVTFDTYPYKYGSSRLVMVIPTWAHEHGPHELVRLLGRRDTRERLREEMGPRGSSWQEMWLTNFRVPHNRVFEGRSVAEISVLRGDADPIDTVCDLLVEEDLRLSFVNEGAEGFTRSKFLTHPLGMIGSDGLLLGENPSPRTYGTFPEVLGEFSRDEGFLRLSDAIRRMTSYAAMRLGLRDRGLIRDGLAADLVLFDPGSVASPATRADPRRFPSGIDMVVVNGQVAVEDGEPTGVLAGRALRSTTG